MQSVSRSVETYRDWRKNDPAFRRLSDEATAALKSGVVEDHSVPDFPEFAAKYLGKPLPLHHLRIWDALNDREPRDLHESMQWQRGAEDVLDNTHQVIINIPPDHAKSTTWSVNWVIWQIVRNPDIRIGIVSKTQSLAKKFLSQIKFVLTNPDVAEYRDLHEAFAPAGGWRSDEKGDGLAWREDRFYIKGRTTAEKDPTVEALGIGGHIYGARFDILLLDDIEDFSSASQFEHHADYISQDVYSRLDKEHGQLILLGTRVGVMDIYRYLRETAVTEDGDPFYTYFAQPAILEGESSHSTEWKVLWPERLPARRIAKAKSAMTDPRRFTFVYQQRDVSLDATFPAVAVDASVNGMRRHGPMVHGAPGNRPYGMDGLYRIGSWDPASSAGRNAMLVYGVDKFTKQRWIVDFWIKKGAVPRETIALLKEWTTTYGINEWRIEKNAVQQFITQLPEIRDFLTQNGCRLVEHQTTGNKWDPGMGVEGTLVPLFLSCVDEIGDAMRPRTDGHGLINLPSTKNDKFVKELVEQLKSWEPDNKRLTQDGVMALWFAELAAIKFLRGGMGNTHHMPGKWTTKAAANRRTVVSIDELNQRGMLRAL